MIGSDTRLVAIIGSPIAQVKSPDNFNDYFARQNANRVMIAIDLSPEKVSDFVATVRGWQNLDGFVVTIPHKTAVAGLVDDLTETARFLGAANVVKRHPDGRLSADMTDGIGFLSAAKANGFHAVGKTVLMIGAGAAGSAIGHALAGARIAKLVITDVNQGRADDLAGRLARAFPSVSISAGVNVEGVFDLVVNASSCGMRDDDPLPVSPDILDLMPKDGLVADVVTTPTMTPLLALAEKSGLKFQTGQEMAKAQLFALGDAMGVMTGDHPGD